MYNSSRELYAALADQFRNDDIKPDDLELLLGQVKSWICRVQPSLRRHAEDLAQDTVIRAYKGIDGFRSEASFFSWVITIARRVVYDPFQQQGGACVALQDVSEPEDDKDWEDNILLGWELDRAREKLSETEHEAIRLHIHEGYSHREIAQTLNLPGSNASQQAVKRGCKKIKEHLAENGYSFQSYCDQKQNGAKR